MACSRKCRAEQGCDWCVPDEPEREWPCLSCGYHDAVPGKAGRCERCYSTDFAFVSEFNDLFGT